MDVTNPYTIALVVIAAGLAVVAWDSSRQQETPGAVYFFAFLVGAIVWTLGAAGSVATNDPGGFAVAQTVVYVGVAIVPAAWLLFTLDYTGRDRWITPWLLVGLAVVPVASVLLAVTNRLHGLFWTVSGSTTLFGTEVLYADVGPWFWFNAGYSYLLVAVATALFVGLITRSPALYVRRGALVLVGIFAPIVVNVFFLLETLPPQVDPTPFGFAVTGLAFGLGLFRRQLFDTPPIAPAAAHGTAFEEMDDAAIIVDADRRIVEFNPAARTLFGEEPPRRGDELGSSLPAVADLIGVGDSPQVVRIETAEGESPVEVRISAITRSGSEPIGWLCTLYDVTERRLREQRLNVLHRILRHNVRQETNLVLGNTRLVADAVDDEAARDRLAAAERAAERLVDWSERAQSVERFLSPVGDDRTEVDLVELLEAAAEEARLRHPDARIETELPARLPALGHAALQDALFELLVNAVEHNDDPEPWVNLEARERPDGPIVRIRDDGPGLPAAERRVLERGSETPLEHSSGLGLWLVNWAITAAGGTIEFSVTESGTAIEIRLPPPGTATADGRRDAGVATD